MSNAVIFARMEKTRVEQLKEICHNRGEDLSDFVRRAVLSELGRLSFLTPEEKKALGIAVGRSNE